MYGSVRGWGGSFLGLLDSLLFYEYLKPPYLVVPRNEKKCSIVTVERGFLFLYQLRTYSRLLHSALKIFYVYFGCPKRSVSRLTYPWLYSGLAFPLVTSAYLSRRISQLSLIFPSPLFLCSQKWIIGGPPFLRQFSGVVRFQYSLPEYVKCDFKRRF